MRRFPMLSLLVAALIPVVAAAEPTISQPITELSYNAAGDYLYVRGSGSWGPPSCSGATFILITSTIPNYQKMTAIILAAHMSGKSVKFAGSCYSDPDYFTANYIWVE
jgi:hypothetical protein